jgi:hypothetical protein
MYYLNSNPSLDGKLHYPSPGDIGHPLNEVVTDKIRDYSADYNNRPSNGTTLMISFVTDVVRTSGRQGFTFSWSE